MPTRGPRICGCGFAVASGTLCACAKRRKAEAEAKAARPSAAKRGYDLAWRRVRGAFLKRHPTCCEAGCGQPATDVDHIQSIRERPDLRLVWSNLRPFCHPHHSRRTAIDQGFARRGGGEGRNLVQGGETVRGTSPRESAELGFSGRADD